MLTLLQTYSKELTALAAVLITWALNRYARPRARLIYSMRHSFTFIVDEPLKDAEGKQVSTRQGIYTASAAVTNVGRDTAKNVEIVLNWKPMFLNIWPSRHYDERASAHDRHSLFLASLAPKESINLELLSINAKLPDVITVRSDETLATEREMSLQPVHSRWAMAFYTWLAFAGIATTGYLVAYFIEFLSVAAT